MLPKRRQQMHFERLLLALQFQAPQRRGYRFRQQGLGVRADRNGAWWRLAFDPGGDVDRVANDGVRTPACRAQQTDGDLAGVNSHSESRPSRMLLGDS